MKLYYDKIDNIFTLKETETCECVFESYERDGRVGWEKGKNPPIKRGTCEIIIETNFYPKAKKQEYLCVKILINGVLLLPLSKACRKAIVHSHFRKDSIAHQQYERGGKEPSTIVQIHENINWENALWDICEICNNYEKWIINEMKCLILLLSTNKNTKFYDIATLLELVRVYEKIAPGIIPVYRDFVDLHCFEAMKEVLKFIESHRDMNATNKVMKARNGDVIWGYIKDYYMKM